MIYLIFITYVEIFLLYFSNLRYTPTEILVFQKKKLNASILNDQKK